MPNLFKLAICFCIVSLLWSCGSSTPNASNTSSEYILIAVDSLQVQELSELQMADYHEEKELLLLENYQNGEVLLVDNSGEIAHKFNPYIQGPNSIGGGIYGWTFHGEDELLTYGRTHFHRLNFNGERQQRYDYPLETYGAYMLDHNPLMIQSYEAIQGTETLVMITVPSRISEKSQMYQDSVNVLYNVNFETGKVRSVMQKPADGLLRNLGKYAGQGFPRSTKISGSLFAVAYEIEPKVYVYDLTDNSLVSELEIPAAYHAKFRAIDFESRGEYYLNKGNNRIFSDGKHIILEVSTDLPEEVLQELKTLPTGARDEALRKAYEKYVTNQYLLFSKDEFLGEIEWEPGMVNYRILGSDNGHLWMERRYDDERDYHTFVKYRIGQIN